MNFSLIFSKPVCFRPTGFVIRADPVLVSVFIYMFSFICLLYSCKSVLKIRNDIIDMLCADGQTDGILMYPLVFQFLI